MHRFLTKGTRVWAVVSRPNFFCLLYNSVLQLTSTRPDHDHISTPPKTQTVTEPLGITRADPADGLILNPPAIPTPHDFFGLSGPHGAFLGAHGRRRVTLA